MNNDLLGHATITEIYSTLFGVFLIVLAFLVILSAGRSGGDSELVHRKRQTAVFIIAVIVMWSNVLIGTSKTPVIDGVNNQTLVLWLSALSVIPVVVILRAIK